MTDMNEVRDEYYDGLVGRDLPDPVGYGKPPIEHQFKPGQSGNRYGRPRKRRRPDPPADLMVAVMDELNQPLSIKTGGKVVTMPCSQAIAKMLIRDMMKDGHHRYRAVSLLARIGIFDAANSLAEIRHNQEMSSSDSWTPEMEKRFQEIEAEFFDNLDNESDDDDDASSGIHTRPLD